MNSVVRSYAIHINYYSKGPTKGDGNLEIRPSSFLLRSQFHNITALILLEVFASANPYLITPMLLSSVPVSLCSTHLSQCPCVLVICPSQWRCVNTGRKGAAPPKIFR